MLERIQRIKGIGLLHDANASRYGLKKSTLIYADNGRGKSTLASIFRSCSVNNPKLILDRHTIDGGNAPEINFQFTNGNQCTFQNGIWNQPYADLLVFDTDFVEQNVYSGGEVTTDQRRNLLQFALGENAVIAQREYDEADSLALTAAADVREAISQLSSIHKGLTLTQFLAIENVQDADAQISDLNEKIIEAQNIGLILAKAIPQQLITPPFDIEPIFRILATSLENVDLAAEEKVKKHLETHQKANLEKWVSDGYAFGEESTCLFCSQPLDGIQLIQAYRSYFNNDYKVLKNEVVQLNSFLSRLCSDVIIERLKSGFATASAIIDGWQEHVAISPPTFDEALVLGAIGEIRQRLSALVHIKESNLLESIGSDSDKAEIEKSWRLVLDAIIDCNKSIATATQLITDYKQALTSLNIHNLQEQIRNLEWAKLRFRQDVVDLISQLEARQAKEIETRSKKVAKKDALNLIMQATLENYKDRINELLRGFGAQFTIPNIDFNYRGGLRSDYVLQMRGANIALSGGIPDFKTCLSEGDKRTLAFAFFVASTESAPNLMDKIIVIDDPMSSFDLNRKQQTRTVLKRLHDRCEQLIVLAHDIHFIRNLRDDLLRDCHPQDIKCIKLKAVVNRYSDFAEVDIDQECESSYYKCHRVLNQYKAGTASSSMEVARSIRPMLEGYLHRRFPGLINRGLLFGDVISLIANAQRPSPLVCAQNIVNELNEINRYAGQFHHDTNPAADQVQIIDGELLGFVERSITVVHSGA